MTKRQLDTIITSTSDKYLQKIGAYLRRRQQRHNDAQKMIVVKSDDGSLYIGTKERGPLNAFIGCRLIEVCTRGNHARSFCIPAGGNWKEVKNFWASYIELGVCLLDPDHDFYSHRWTLKTPAKRMCRFCGRQEKRRFRRRVVVYQKWVKI